MVIIKTKTIIFNMKIPNKFYQRIASFLPDSIIRVESVMRESSGSSKIPSREIKRESEIFTPKKVRDWRNAVAMATDPETPNFSELADLHKNLLLDPHTASVIDSRILKVQRSVYHFVDENGDVNPDLGSFFKTVWFEQFVRNCLMFRFTGVKVIENFELDQNLELVKSDVIPMEHVNPKIGHILKNVGDDKGISYREGAYEPYYIQIGEARDLGMLTDLAPLIIAKKFCKGSWLDLIEKYGIPFRYVKTDNMTKKRQKELFDMLIKSISNSVAVLQGNETIEISESLKNDPHHIFKEFLSYIDSSISKAILGQDGTTDNKEASGTYGSLKVLQDVANDRHESDKLFVMSIINKILIPKLIKLSSFYAPLEGYRFDWDSSEEMTREQLIDSVVSLTNAGYTIDYEQISEKTGIPITGYSANTNSVEPEDKKKSLKNK
ncbi:DUF935 family protein [Kordia sp. TARA_039_SRF]|nr:DUF935 family protein [Kordia sp. TARA_039_SRF]